MELSTKIEAYLEDHKTAWSPATLRSETSRLKGLRYVINQGPSAVYEYLVADGYKPYAIKTIFIRICRLEAWAKSGTDYQEWYAKHRNRFKHAYRKLELSVSYEDAVTRIETLTSPYREQAKEMLITGLRISEVEKVTDGVVIGKGDKARKIFGTITKRAPQSTFRAKLKAVGLSPHMLRKLRATDLASKGATPADLCKVFGWSSIVTAYQYLQPQSEERLKRLMEP